MAIEDNNNGTQSNAGTTQKARLTDDVTKMSDSQFGQYKKDIGTQFQNIASDVNTKNATNNAYTKSTNNFVAQTQEDMSNAIPQKPKKDGRQYLIDYYTRKVEETEQPTAEMLKKERRRRRTEMAIAGMSDMARAVSNLVFTAQGAPNMYDPSADMSPKYKGKWDKIKAENEQRKKENADWSLRLYEAMMAKDDAAAKQIQTDLDNKIKELKAANESKKAELQALYFNDKIDKAEYNKQIKQAELDLKKQIAQERINLLKAQTWRTRNAPFRSGGRSGGGSRNSGRTIEITETEGGGALGDKKTTVKKKLTPKEYEEYLRKKKQEEEEEDYDIPGAK